MSNRISLKFWFEPLLRERANGREFFIYAVYKVQLSLHLIHDDYRLRFGIESSYRMKNLCRIKTTIKNPTIRFLFVALSFLIINIWIYLIWNYLSRLKRSSRQVFSHLFTLKQMLEFLPQAIDRIYGVACEVCLPSGWFWLFFGVINKQILSFV